MGNKPKISVLVSTMNERISHVIDYLLPQLQDADEIIIVHQITDSNIAPLTSSLGEKVTYVSMREAGLSKSRNTALSVANGDVCYICDDDLEILPNAFEIMRNAYEKISADAITFQTQDETGQNHFQVQFRKHSQLSILRVWSWGISFRRDFIKKHNIRFDEKFGLGATYPVGEENIFLKDIFNAGGKIFHDDNIIAMHPRESSGIQYRDELILARTQVWKRLFGFPGALFSIFYFTILHYPLYREKYSIGKFFILSCKGYRDINNKGNT